jgi:uncharacterized membrane protein
MRHLIAFGAGVLTLGLLDFVWLGVVMRDFYRSALGPLAITDASGALTPIWSAAVPVYLLIVVGVLLFAVPRADSLAGAAAWGALFGLVVYGTYDLTNLATLKGYPVRLAVADMLWGACVCASTAVAMYAVSDRLSR